ncbi:hypothetical protein EVAR_29218_1 [Eumeta japonica]|uniref:Uncharacterized protein n=1 Tax=Eumeta variegata TaxID=151549 RepID=A0A4C1VK80_EUMVA|nr:hypothetical protein EVAR_29218_1 [Eumeta japonica]
MRKDGVRLEVRSNFLIPRNTIALSSVKIAEDSQQLYQHIMNVTTSNAVSALFIGGSFKCSSPVVIARPRGKRYGEGQRTYQRQFKARPPAARPSLHSDSSDAARLIINHVHGICGTFMG